MKIPANKVQESVWAEVDDERVELDTEEIERLFAARVVHHEIAPEGTVARSLFFRAFRT